ncbi:hypothetical protein C0995_013700 [Termitomyces sp. Mi166|nr:hypothetical protein C0995_013700 [Termitomyces sp. Mi166\
MSTTTTSIHNQTTARGAGKRGGKPRGGINRGRGGRSNSKAPAAAPPSEPETKEKEPEKILEEVAPSADASEDADVCWICAEPVKYYSVSQCNHRTCHVCALRLRALYKKLDCTFCKEPQPTVIFTASAEESFSSYTPDSIPYKDTKLSIFFETQEMMEETLLLLRFNCPDSDCPYIGNGWGDLKLHVRATHGKLMCFQNYESLENHFNSAHHPCTQSQCLTRKFVVFNTPLDLQAHMVEEHGSDMSSRDKKDARRVQAEFEFEEVGRHGRRGGHRDREREPPPHHRQGQQDSGPSSTPIVLRPPGPGRRREGFGANLTVEGASSSTPEPSRPPSPPRGDVDPAVLERHEMFIGRLQSLAANPTTAVPVVKAAIRGYRASESSAKDFISTIWHVLDQNLEHTASIINAFVDLLDQEEKKQDLLSSWKGFEIEQRRQFPDLVPTAIAPSGTAGYAAITTGRVLNAKHATATRSAQRSSRQVWDRVAQAANATRPVDRFPALSSSNAGPSHTPAHRQTQRTTAWSTSASGGGGNTSSSSSRPTFMPTPAQASSSHITVVPDPRSSRPPSGRNTPQAPPPKLSNALFPELPSSTPARPKASVKGNVSLQNILGNPMPPAVSAWGGGGASAVEGNGSNDAPSAGRGKKGKGKQKQTLFTLGSFQT